MKIITSRLPPSVKRRAHEIYFDEVEGRREFLKKCLVD